MDIEVSEEEQSESDANSTSTEPLPAKVGSATTTNLPQLKSLKIILSKIDIEVPEDCESDANSTSTEPLPAKGSATIPWDVHPGTIPKEKGSNRLKRVKKLINKTSIDNDTNPTKKAPVPRANKKAPVPRANKKAPVPRANKKAPVPRANKKAPVPRANKKAPVPRANKKAPVPRANKKAPVPRANKKAPVPRANKKAPVQRTRQKSTAWRPNLKPRPLVNWDKIEKHELIFEKYKRCEGPPKSIYSNPSASSELDVENYVSPLVSPRERKSSGDETEPFVSGAKPFKAMAKTFRSPTERTRATRRASSDDDFIPSPKKRTKKRIREKRKSVIWDSVSFQEEILPSSDVTDDDSDFTKRFYLQKQRKLSLTSESEEESSSFNGGVRCSQRIKEFKEKAETRMSSFKRLLADHKVKNSQKNKHPINYQRSQPNQNDEQDNEPDQNDHQYNEADQNDHQDNEPDQNDHQDNETDQNHPQNNELDQSYHEGNAPVPSDHEGNAPVPSDHEGNAPVPSDHEGNAPVPSDHEGNAPVPSDHEGNAPVPSDHEGNAPVPSDHEGNAPVPSDHEGNAPVPSDHEGNAPVPSDHEGNAPVPSDNEGKEPVASDHKSNKPVVSDLKDNKAVASDHEGNEPVSQYPKGTEIDVLNNQFLTVRGQDLEDSNEVQRLQTSENSRASISRATQTPPCTLGNLSLSSSGSESRFKINKLMLDFADYVNEVNLDATGCVIRGVAKLVLDMSQTNCLNSSISTLRSEAEIPSEPRSSFVGDAPSTSSDSSLTAERKKLEETRDTKITIKEKAIRAKRLRFIRNLNELKLKIAGNSDPSMMDKRIKHYEEAKMIFENLDKNWKIELENFKKEQETQLQMELQKL